MKAKTKYSAPATACHQIALQDMVCTSLPANEETIKGEDALSKDNDMWDGQTWDTWEDDK